MSAPTKAPDEFSSLTRDEIVGVISPQGQPSETLDNIARLIQARFGADAGAVYLVEPDRATLMLVATTGPGVAAMGPARTGLDEDLPGQVVEDVRPVAVEDVTRHPRYKFTHGDGAPPFRSFLGVPLTLNDQGVVLGVLAVQTVAPRSYTAGEVAALAAAAAQLGPIVAEARTLARYIAPIYERIWAVARNLWWCWDAETTNLFRELDPDKWRALDHNPVALLNQMSPAQLDERAARFVLHSQIHYVYRRMQEYLNSTRTWGARHCGVLKARPVAYFSAEFGLHECLPIYSGGLGVLSGDHVKSASDLGVPLVGVGLFYAQGYFRQKLDLSGWQREEYLDVDTRQLPLELVTGWDKRPITVTVETRGPAISARVWRAAVGRNAILLLDSDVEANTPEDRQLTARLYGGDDRLRIRQELLLGVGGMRALRALRIQPGVLHLNEGHSAFAGLELIRARMQNEGLRFEEALRRVSRRTVFTTHTPVPAGHDRFSPGLVEEHLGPLREALGLSPEALMELGRESPTGPAVSFCMTALALRTARRANAVSSLHGSVSRAMWAKLYPNRREDEVPIGHITNGVHVHTWLAPQMRRLYDRHLGPEWAQRSGEPDVWEGIEDVNSGELWETHQVLKSRLIAFVRRRAAAQAGRRGEPREAVDRCRRALSLDALTIGFARRFATYKRADLIFRDLELIASLVNDPQRPVQLVFAGKAHPRDDPAKHLLRRISEYARAPQFAGKLVFVEDYDINVARHLVQGVDVWLNNPRRPQEASGTSGEKVVLNGGLNLSVLDGWWAEAYDGTNGFAIGMGEAPSTEDRQDRMDAEALARALTEEVIPLYFDRDHDGLPRRWVARMKSAIRSLGWRFNADRMVMDYVLKCYLPAAGGTSSDMSQC